MEWRDVTVDQFCKIEEYLEDGGKEDNNVIQAINMLAILNDQEVEYYAKMPISELTRCIHELDFMQSTPQAALVKNRYVINGRTYELNTTFAQFTAAQYIDYQMYAEEPKKNRKQILSIFLIPKGKKYNEGYDIQQVIDDAGYLPIEDCYGISFFLFKILNALTRTTLSSAVKKTKKEMKKIQDNEKRKILLDGLTKLLNG